MKVLHLCPSFWPNVGGVETFIHDLAKQSRRNGVDAQVLTFATRDRQGNQHLRNEDVDGIPVRRIPFVNSKYYKPSWPPLSELRDADVLHVHNVGALLDFAVATRGFHRTPIVVSTHGGIFHTADLSRLKHWYFYGLQRHAFKHVAGVIADSKNDLELFSGISDRTTLIEIGVDVDRFGACGMECRADNVMLFVGRIARNKRIDNLVRACGNLRERGAEPCLRIVGPDWEGLQASLQQLAAKLGIADRVTFVGEVSDAELLSELCRARFFVSASEYEGFGISVIEAMAAGCVPVVNRIESFRNFVEDGVNGFLADFRNSSEVGTLLDRLLHTELQAASKAARERAQAFSWAAKMGEWKQVYDAAIRGVRFRGVNQRFRFR